jgi:hypothetical protein
MMLRRVLVTGSVLALVAVTGMAAAGAEPTRAATGGAKATVTGNVQIDPANPAIAYVSARYVCPPGDAHLWVSVKQGVDSRPDNALKAEGSSGISDAWLQRHPGPDEFTCDGTWHTGTWSIDAGLSEYGFGELEQGQVYVQFCLTGPEIAPEQPAWFAFSMRFAVAA